MRGGVVFGRVFLMVGVIFYAVLPYSQKEFKLVRLITDFRNSFPKCVFVNRVEIGIADIKGLFWKLGSHRVSQSGDAKG